MSDRISGRIPFAENSRISDQIEDIAISVYTISKKYLLETVTALMLKNASGTFLVREKKTFNTGTSDVIVYFILYGTY
jgi:hypothetical protein